MNNTLKGFSSLLVATFLYAFFAVFTRYIGFEFGVFYGAWTRSVFGAAILLGILLMRQKWGHVAKKDWVWIAARAIAGCLAFSLNYYAFYYLPLATVLFIFYAGSTIGGYILGKILFQEHLNRVKIISLVLAMTGLGVIYLVNFKISDPFYMILAVVGGFFTAVWNTFSKKISGSYSSLQLNLLDMALSAVFFFLGFLVMKEKWIPLEMNMLWGASALFALIFLFTGQLVIYGFRFLDAQIASITMLSEIVFGIGVGWLVFQEQPTIYTFIGGAIIIIAILYPEISALRQKRKNKVDSKSH